MRRARLAAFLGIVFLSIACSEPPEKEMQQAQGAIDAARAVGADDYAHDEFASAIDTLKRAHDAADDRDYRLALNLALDSRERAQSAAREAADRKSALRVQADRTISAAADAITRAETHLKTAEATRPSARTTSQRRGVDHARAQLQEARAAMTAGKYAEADRSAKAALAALSPVSASTDSPAGKPAKAKKP